MILKFRNHIPKIAQTAYIADGVFIIGEVEIGEFSSVWFGSVLRGDGGKIKIGNFSNIQDNCVLHEGVEIGDNVTVGHRAILHSCCVHNNALIGAGAIVWDGCVIGEGALVGVGSVLPPHMIVPPKTLVLGIPGKIIRDLTEQEITTSRFAAQYYKDLAQEYKLKLNTK